MLINEYNATWRINSVCNFKCSYCILNKNATDRPIQYVKKMISVLEEHGNKWTIIIEGMEPLLCPNIIDICVQLTGKFNITVFSNLSISDVVREFADRIDPGKAKIMASTHIQERERKGNVEEFIENILLLKDKRFRVHTNYVMHPTLFKRFEADYKYFLTRGIRLMPTGYVGWYKARVYPMSYTLKQKEIISKYHPGLVSYPRCYKNIGCAAGQTSIRIDENGVVNRCVSDKSVLGTIQSGFKLYDNPRRCRKYMCQCDGHELVHKKNALQKKSIFKIWHLILAKKRGRYEIVWRPIVRKTVAILGYAIRDSRYNFVRRLYGKHTR
ncbi:radical SAM protein [Elusimicrobiota bacterium]